MNLFTRLSRLRYPYEPLITVEISKSRLLHNLQEFERIAPHGRIAPVLKSNAYGHGLIEIAKILETERKSHEHFPKPAKNIAASISSTPFIVVDSYFEAVALRAKGIKAHILIIGYTRPETIIASSGANTSYTITSLETLKEIDSMTSKKRPERLETGAIDFFKPLRLSRGGHLIHLKIDTGMHRQGILPEEISEAISIIKSNPNIVLEGICSHLADADNNDESFTESQINVWNKYVKVFKQEFPTLRYYHLSNTDGHRFAKDIDANVSRLGIGLYGISDTSEITKSMDLQPALEMKTVVTSVKHLKDGECVGYSKTYKACKDCVIGTIPVGYFEGLDRRLSNKGFVLVGTDRVPCPIVGRVSMNITSIDMSAVPNIKIGDPVVVISSDPKDPNSIVSIARACETIPYEIAVKIPAHLKRVVIK